jgi:peptide/nickel transport system permease protein
MLFQYGLRRLISAVITLALVSFIVFIVIALPPGDYAEKIVYGRQAETGMIISDADIQNVRIQLGLDRPFHEQYFTWVSGIVTEWDFGFSFRYFAPVTEVINTRIGYTALIVTTTLTFIYLLAIPIGVFSAVKQYSPGDYLFSFMGYIGLSIPNFLTALILLYISATVFDTSVGGLFSPGVEDDPWSMAKLLDLLSHLWIPAVVLSLSGTAFQIRVIRATLLDELNRLYVTAARARGVPEGRLLWKYPVRLSLNPLVSTLGYEVASAVSGTMVVSLVLVIPDLGPLFLKALTDQDMYLAGTIILLLSALTIVGTFLSDILLALLDPRIRMGYVK